MAINKFMSNDVERIVSVHVANEIRTQLTEEIIKLVRKDVDALVEDYTRKLVVKVHEQAFGFDRELRTHITIDFKGGDVATPHETARPNEQGE